MCFDYTSFIVQNKIINPSYSYKDYSINLEARCEFGKGKPNPKTSHVANKVCPMLVCVSFNVLNEIITMM